ncbi:MAG: nucleotidyltransferase domain-containing protein [archaeon]|nr:nucleotidyltransferase domain-containing protein [archaeon]
MKNKIGIDIVDFKEVIGIIKELKKKIPNKGIYLFGSILNKTAIRYESDADILIIPKNNENFNQLYSLAWNATKKLLDKGIAPHIIIYNQQSHSSLLKEIKKKGRAI